MPPISPFGPFDPLRLAELWRQHPYNAQAPFQAGAIGPMAGPPYGAPALPPSSVPFPIFSPGFAPEPTAAPRPMPSSQPTRPQPGPKPPSAPQPLSPRSGAIHDIDDDLPKTLRLRYGNETIIVDTLADLPQMTEAQVRSLDPTLYNDLFGGAPESLVPGMIAIEKREQAKKTGVPVNPGAPLSQGPQTRAQSFASGSGFNRMGQRGARSDNTNVKTEPERVRPTPAMDAVAVEFLTRCARAAQGERQGHKKERGGRINLRNGRYAAGPMVTGTTRDITVGTTTSTVSWVHTHPKSESKSRDRIDEKLSSRDRKRTNKANAYYNKRIVAYLGTPSGAVRRFGPDSYTGSGVLIRGSGYLDYD